MLTSKRKLLFTKNIPGVTYEAALAAIQDPPTLINLSPVVIDYENTCTGDPNFYTVTDKLSVLGIPMNTVYTAKFTRVDVAGAGGIDSDCVAGAGTRLLNQWRAKETSTGVRVTEEVTVHANSLMIAYTVGVLRKAHALMLDRLADKLTGKELQHSTPPQSANSKHQQPESTLIPLFFALAPVLLTLAVRRIHPNFEHITAFATVVGLLSIVARSVFTAKKEPYGLFHLVLNKLPAEKPEDPPKTEWLNLGYWKDTRVFTEACEALASKLIAAAHSKEGGNVLDVGHGTGESLLLLLRQNDVPRPGKLTGITSLEGHYQRSKDRVEKLREGEPDTPEVSLYHGDAVYHAGDMGHPLFPGSKGPPFDTILALDCAYHFVTREDFLTQSFDRLAPGGHIALADICLSYTARAGFLAWLLGMNRQNMVEAAVYRKQMETLGFVNIEMEDISEHVFPSFVAFMKGRGSGWIVFGHAMEWIAASGGRYYIVSGSKSLE